MKKSKTIFSILLILLLQLPFIVQWHHYVQKKHSVSIQEYNENISKHSFSSCTFLHKVPYGVYYQTTFYFKSIVNSTPTGVVILKTKNKKSVFSHPYLLRAPPIYFFDIA